MQLTMPGGQHLASIDLSTTDAVINPPALIQVGQAGDLKVDTLGGEIGVTVPSVPVGLFACWVTKVYKTGTTAANLSAVWW
ncbi:MAG: hypothetical protein KGL39_07915 [Patescibacteria group bacterium]|nr:hypothetical protein [Patescibacteria group bacterium]